MPYDTVPIITLARTSSKLGVVKIKCWLLFMGGKYWGSYIEEGGCAKKEFVSIRASASPEGVCPVLSETRKNYIKSLFEV